MNVSYEWLRAFVPFHETPAKLRDLITSRVATVDEVVPLRADLEPIVVARVVEAHLPLLYVNQVGGQDELVFEGASFALNADGALAAQLPAFREEVGLTRWTRAERGWRCDGPIAVLEEGDTTDYAACVLGLREDRKSVV